MIRDLPFFGIRAKAEPQHDPWPPTWRLPSGAIRVEASFKEPGRQKLVDKATKAVAFLALAVIVLARDHWPWSDLVHVVLTFIAGNDSIPVTEFAAAWLLVAATGLSMIVGLFRLLLAALGVDHGQIALVFNRDHMLINDRAFERRSVKGFELEPHHLGKVEGHNEKRHGQATSFYYRDAYTIILHYGERRIEIAHVLGRQRAGALLARLQELKKQMDEMGFNRPSTSTTQRHHMTCNSRKPPNHQHHRISSTRC